MSNSKENNSSNSSSDLNKNAATLDSTQQQQQSVAKTEIWIDEEKDYEWTSPSNVQC